MNRMTGTQLRLLTWLDVERLLKQTTHRWADLPENILAVDCFASGMDIYHNGDESQVDQWLTKVFGRLYLPAEAGRHVELKDRKSTRLNSSHVRISYAVFCLKKKKKQ